MERTYNVLLIGKSGTGKSATANTICGVELFKSISASTAVTESFQTETVNYKQSQITVTDTPGIFYSEENDDDFVQGIKRYLTISEEGIHAFIVVLSLRENFTESSIKLFEFFEVHLSMYWENFVILVFTHADCFKDDQSRNLYIKSFPKLSLLLEKFSDRYFFLDNSKIDGNMHSDFLGILVNLLERSELAYKFCHLRDEEDLRSQQKDKIREDIRKEEKEKFELARKLPPYMSVQDIDSKCNCAKQIYICFECKCLLCKECALRHNIDIGASASNHLILRHSQKRFLQLPEIRHGHKVSRFNKIGILVELKEDGIHMKVSFPRYMVSDKMKRKCKQLESITSTQRLQAIPTFKKMIIDDQTDSTWQDMVSRINDLVRKAREEHCQCMNKYLKELLTNICVDVQQHVNTELSLRRICPPENILDWILVETEIVKEIRLLTNDVIFEPNGFMVSPQDEYSEGVVQENT